MGVVDRIDGIGDGVRESEYVAMELMKDSNCDLVVEMEKAGIGVPEIIQYVHACFSAAELAALAQGIGTVISRAEGQPNSGELVPDGVCIGSTPVLPAGKSAAHRAAG